MPPTLPDGDLIVVAKRLANYAESVLQAHRFGHGPGVEDEPWTRRYQRQAVKIYPDTLPWPYLLATANHFILAGRSFTIRAAPEHLVEQWLIVTEYFRTAGEVITESAPRPPPEPDDLGVLTAMPSVMQFDRLAQIVSDDGAKSLHQAAVDVVEHLMAEASASPLDCEDSRIVAQLLSGRRVLDVAQALGYSERSLYRRLDEIWGKVGGTNRTDGLAIIVARGWVKPDPTPPGPLPGRW